ncbi:HDOD domain-containing protein [Rhodoferax saidenbachensis]|uniref:Histidine kinase n=1 Tax=Rhodoferax saidenbachensis TaxID=1484693 RepID=A0A1P8K9N1_9BURK|nr:HDOD domain-containing protein [Rhodoferax saidenbachensis]APW42703.1 histidine kinase [Rhodoferax saidenbachensis]
MANLDSFFESVKLPSMSEVAHALIQTLSDDDVSVGQVRDLIAQDPALSAKLLRLANSAQFGLPRGVGTLDDAITMVGMAKVRTLALGACLSESFPSLPDLDRKEFWRTSMACAGYAQWLATRLSIDGQLAWLTGMMLRLGELLIAQADPVTLHEIEKLPHLPGVRWQREQRLLGFTEGQITAELARRWNFPMQMVQALQRSADPITDQAFSRLGGVVHLAGLLAETDHAGIAAVDELPKEVIAALMLDMDWMRSKLPDTSSFMDVTA